MASKSFFKSYDDIAKWYTKVRNPAKGRPLHTSWRVFDNNKSFVFRLHDVDVCSVHPDNTVTFYLSSDVLSNIGNSVSYTLPRVLPFLIMRVSTGRYCIAQPATIVNASGSYFWQSFKQQAPDAFHGIRFNMADGKCLNPVPKAIRQNEDAAARKEWQKILRRYKNGLYVRIKLGVFDTIYAELHSNNVGLSGAMTLGSHPSFIPTLAKAMRDEEYPPEILRAFCRLRFWWGGRTPDVKAAVRSTIDNVFTTHSVALRREFGVFKEA